jgi:hypothetical protein
MDLQNSGGGGGVERRGGEQKVWSTQEKVVGTYPPLCNTSSR